MEVLLGLIGCGCLVISFGVMMWFVCDGPQECVQAWAKRPSKKA